MEKRADFLKRVREGLNKIDPAVLAYDESEFWMVQAQYEFIEYYAVRHRYHNTALALPLARGLHDGVHRKFSVIKDGVQYKVPYLIHPLRVCHVLIDLRAALSPEEEDIMLAAALCHDVIEDIPLPLHGRELTEVYGMDQRVYDTVLKVTKQRNASPEEEKKHFDEIAGDKLAMLIKLADRSNNVEDLYNMSVAKVHEYVAETRRLVLPMCAYAYQYHPELVPSCALLKDKINCLIETAEAMVDRFDGQEQELRKTVRNLRAENERLRGRMKELWEK